MAMVMRAVHHTRSLRPPPPDGGAAPVAAAEEGCGGTDDEACSDQPGAVSAGSCTGAAPLDAASTRHCGRADGEEVDDNELWRGRR